MEQKRILNVGCGTDTLGTDFLDAYPLRDNVIKWDVNEGKELPYKENTFDQIVCKQFLMYVIDVRAFFEDCKRVLKPDGTIYITTQSAVFGGMPFGGHDGNNSTRVWGNGSYHLFTKNQIYNWLKLTQFREIESHYSIEGEDWKGAKLRLMKLAIQGISLISPTLKPHVTASAKK